ncbi:MAG: type III pantothenate kinase [Gammaproteobacteria bacterium]|nr:type III pantothenate kinase [Gammaproteobacteria bacterium]
MTTDRILDLDVGNTRLKWRCGDARGSVSGLDIPYLAKRPARVRVSSVAGDDVRRQLRDAIADAYGVQAEFASSSGVLAGVRCGYDDPAKLGVDRWLAMVAAWNAVRCSCAVVDVGTAATLDFVQRDGCHQGGYIVPGLTLMVRALAQDTADVRVAGELSQALEPGLTTAHAVRRGTTAMLLGFVESCVVRFSQRCEDAPVVFLTGGDTDIIANRLSFAVRIEPDLVLDGLHYALP